MLASMKGQTDLTEGERERERRRHTHTHTHTHKPQKSMENCYDRYRTAPPRDWKNISDL